MLQTVQFPRRLFNPLYFHIQKYINDPTVRRIMVFGSSSAAKTYSIAQNLIVDGGLVNKYNTLAFRKESSNIKDTIKNDFDEIIGRILGQHPLDTLFRKMDMEFRTSFGNVIRLRGLDTSGKIKGVKGFRKVYLDELDQFTFDDWKELNRRLRGDINQQIIASWNPVSENHWIKVSFIDKVGWTDEPTEIEGNPYSKLDDMSYVRRSDDGRTILIKTVFQDNKWVVGGQVGDVTYGRRDEQVIADFKEMELIYPYDYYVYGLGEWGVIRPDTPYLSNYVDDIHYPNQSFGIDNEAVTWFSFDFNHTPTTCGVYQIRPKIGVIRVKEFEVNGGTRNLCQTIKGDPEIMAIDKLLWNITGDSSGNSYTSSGGDVNDYKIIMEELEVTDNQFINTGGVNARHVYSRRVNDEFLFKIPFYMDASCVSLRKDFQKAKPDDHGKLYKDRGKGYAMDQMDNHRYFVHALCPKGTESINELKRFFLE